MRKEKVSNRRLYLRLLKHIKPYRKQFGGGILAMILLAATEPAIPALLKPLLDGSFVEKDPKLMYWMPFAVVALFLVRGSMNFAASIAMNWVGGRIVLDLRKKMFDRLLVLPASYYDNHSTGNIINRLIANVTKVTNAATSAITVLVKDSLAVVGLLAYAFYLNWQLALTFFMVLPPIIYVVRYFARRMRRLSTELQETMGDLTHVMEEAVHGQKVIKIFGGQAYERKRLAHVANWVRRYQFKIRAAGAANVPLVELLAAVLMAIIIHVGTQQAAAEHLTVGGFVAFFTALGLLLSPIKRLTGISQPLQRGLAAAENVFDLIDEEPEQDRGTMELPTVKGELEFRNISLRYQQARENTLQGVSFKVAAGSTVALVGPSGSGKSSIVSLIPRFYRPTEGTILLDGIDIEQLKLHSLRAALSLVNQDLVLFNDTIAANIGYGLAQQPDEQTLIEAAKAAHAHEFIQRMPERFETIIGENGVRLSGGQRQRLAIARALLKDAPLLILDEATSALDTESERQVQAALENLKKDRTTLVIAHRLSTIIHADEILVVKAGRIVERGTHTELLALDGHYAQLYRTQFLQKQPQSSKINTDP